MNSKQKNRLNQNSRMVELEEQLATMQQTLERVIRERDIAQIDAYNAQQTLDRTQTDLRVCQREKEFMTGLWRESERIVELLRADIEALETADIEAHEIGATERFGEEWEPIVIIRRENQFGKTWYHFYLTEAVDGEPCATGPILRIESAYAVSFGMTMQVNMRNAIP